MSRPTDRFRKSSAGSPIGPPKTVRAVPLPRAQPVTPSPPPDAAAGAPTFMVHADGEQYGPIDERELQMWAYEKRVSPGTMIRIVTSHEWKTADSFNLTFPDAPSGGVVVQNYIQNVAPAESVYHSQQTNNALAAFLSFLIPGVGQLVQGPQQQTKGILMLIGYLISLTLVFTLVFFVIGIFFVPVIWLWSIVDAAVYQPPRRKRR
jgi:TM2 domain-containing membrane protein YozV